MPLDQHPEPDRSPAGPKRILIVEDNELNMKLLHDLLEVHGYDILTTGDGAAAIALARAHHPDLILMDIQLPDISGLDVARMLKADAATQTIPIIAVTAFAMAGDERRTLESGCDGYVSKPINIRDFLRVVGTYLADPDPDSAGPGPAAPG
jgi:two-component system cell cycle response regulator DivK